MYTYVYAYVYIVLLCTMYVHARIILVWLSALLWHCVVSYTHSVGILFFMHALHMYFCVCISPSRDQWVLKQKMCLGVATLLTSDRTPRVQQCIFTLHPSLGICACADCVAVDTVQCVSCNWSALWTLCIITYIHFYYIIMPCKLPYILCTSWMPITTHTYVCTI